MSKNKLIKKANVLSSYTPDDVLELKKCAEDVVYFAKNYIYLQHPTKGLIKFDCYDYQEEILKAFQEERLCIVRVSRQAGKTVCAATFLLWYSIFNKDKTVLLVSNKNKNAMEIVHRIRIMYENLPDWLKPGITDDGWNKHSVGFDNGSRILSEATTPDSARGMSLSKIMCDELAFVKKSICTEFWASVSATLATGGEMIICSTPNGDDNLYAELWRGAEAGTNGFKPMFAPWTKVPGRDEAWKQRELSKIGEILWRQEYECEFLSSDDTMINQLYIQRQQAIIKSLVPLFKTNKMLFWELPNENKHQRHKYLVAVDPSTGSGNDFSVIQVFHFPSLRQVAEFRDNHCSTVELYQFLKSVLKFVSKNGLNEVFFTTENNGIGEGLVAMYESDESPAEATLISEDGKNRIGFTTTNRSKVNACIKLKEMLESNKMKISSQSLLTELKNFVRKKTTYTAQTGSTDDCISACLLIIRMVEDMMGYDDLAHNIMLPTNIEELNLDQLYQRTLHGVTEEVHESYDDSWNPPAISF